jgi:hypothetical protein
MKNKIFLGVMIGILLISLVSAAWYFAYTSGFSVRIDSFGSQKDVILNMPDISINTSQGSSKGNGQTSFAFNKAGSFKVDITETFGDLSAGQCLNGTNDCVVDYSFDDGSSVIKSLNDKQIITLNYSSNLRTIYANITCVAYSCPQTRDIIIKLNQLS